MLQDPALLVRSWEVHRRLGAGHGMGRTDPQLVLVITAKHPSSQRILRKGVGLLKRACLPRPTLGLPVVIPGQCAKETEEGPLVSSGLAQGKEI